MRHGRRNIWIATFLLLCSGFLCGCSAGSGGTTTGNPLTEDTSPSGTAAAVVGGALSGSSSTGDVSLIADEKMSFPYGAQAERQLNAVLCPTWETTGSACTASGESLYLEYNDCHFAGSGAVWQGMLAITKSAGSAPQCGTFPAPSLPGSLYRQYVDSSSPSSPYYATVTNSLGTTAVIDDVTSDLGNYDGQTIATINNGGYGTEVDFKADGTRDKVTVGYKMDIGITTSHSITGFVTIAEVSGQHQRTVTGSLTTYHNLLRVIATSTFNSVTHDDTCCLPIEGSITTTFAAAADAGSVPSHAPTAAGSLLVGYSETLHFTGSCGVGVLTNTYNNTSVNVALTRCF